MILTQHFGTNHEGLDGKPHALQEPREQCVSQFGPLDTLSGGEWPVKNNELFYSMEIQTVAVTSLLQHELFVHDFAMTCAKKLC